jgi:hypothetical protein
MKTRGFIALSVLLMTGTSACAQSGEPRTSICELATAGEQMNGRHVRLTAVYITDLLERDGLKDSRCPKLYLQADWTISQKNGQHDPSLDAFDKEVFARPPDYRELTQFSIDVSGKFVWKANENPHGTLLFEKIWSFKRLHGDWNKAQ